jgi:MFS family permease
MVLIRNTRLKTKPPLWTLNYVLISIATLLFWSNYHILMPVLPKYTLHLGVDGKFIGLTNSVFTFSAFLTRPFVGRECDRRGRKVVYIMGLMALFAAPFGNYLANSFICILLLRLVHGAGWAACSTASNTIAADLIPENRRGEGMGYYGMFSTLAQAGAPALGLSLVKTHSYKVVFIVSMMLAGVAILISLPLKLKESSFSPTEKVQPELFDKRAFKVSALMFFLALTYAGTVTFISLCAEDRSIGNIGPFFLAYAFATLVSRLKVGSYYDTKGPTLIITLSMLALITSNMLMASANSLIMFCISGIIFGFGYGSLQPTLLAFSVKGIEPERRGAVNGTVMAAFDIGFGIGSALLGIVADYGGYFVMYITASFAPLTGLILYLIWNRTGRVMA